MTDQHATTTKQPLFSLPACLVIASFICAITTEELLGYQVLVLGTIPVSSYVIMCVVQTAAAAFLLIFGPRLITIIGRPLVLVGIIVTSLAGSMAMAAANTTLAALSLVGFVLLSIASLALKVANLEMLADAPPRKLTVLVFVAVLLQSAAAPIFTLPSTVIWMLAGLFATVGIALIAAAQRTLEHLGAKPDPLSEFRRPFSPSPSVLIGVGIICAGISFLNPLGLYDAITPDNFLSFTFFTHFAAAILFGIIAFASRDSSHSIAFKSVNSIILISFFLMALLGATSFAPRALCTASFSLFEFTTFLAIADLASYSSTNRLRLFGGYYLLLRLSSLAGIAMNAEDVVLTPLGIEASLFGSLLAGACIIAALWLLTEPHLNQFFWGNTAAEIGREVGRAQAEQGGSLIDRSVDILAERHSLTPREREVFALMAQGRSATFIGEELFVSANTVRKHIAHVYEKLGVHSKQELLTLVQRESARMSAR